MKIPVITEGTCVALFDRYSFSGALPVLPFSDDDALLVDCDFDRHLRGFAFGALHQLRLEDQCPHDRYRGPDGGPDGRGPYSLGQSLSDFYRRAVDRRPVRNVANFSKKTYPNAGVRRL